MTIGLRRFARAGIGIAISVVCVALVLRGVDLRQTVDLISHAQTPWLALAILAIGTDLGFRALRWQRLVAPIAFVPLRRLSGYMLVGYLANNVLPARLGELVRSHYLGDRERISRSATLGTVVVERVIDTVVLVGLGAAAILVLNIRGVVASAVLVGIALAGLLCVALAVALAAHRLPGADRISAVVWRWPRIAGPVSRVRDGMRVAALPRTVAVAAALSVVAWTCTVIAFVAVGQSIGIQLTWGEAALLAAGTNLATAVPSGPGYLGTFEYAGQTIALAFGLPAAQGLALALLAHAATLVISSLLGGAALIELGWSSERDTAAAESEAAAAPAPDQPELGATRRSATAERASAGRTPS